jgi:hypothetical protein
LGGIYFEEKRAREPDGVEKIEQPPETSTISRKGLSIEQGLSMPLKYFSGLIGLAH